MNARDFVVGQSAVAAQSADAPQDRPWRILYTIPNFVTAGSGQAMINVIERLDRRIFEPSVAVQKGGGALVGYLESIGVPVIEAQTSVKPTPYATLPVRVAQAGSVLRPLRNDLWHSYHYADDYTEPLVARFAAARGWVYTKKNMSWGGRAWLLRSVMASRIAVQNTGMFEEFFSGRTLRDRCRYVPRGIVAERWAEAEPRLGLRQRFGLPDSAVVVVCVGHLQPRKNQLALVEAIQKSSDLHLFLAGEVLDTDYELRLRSRAHELDVSGRVHFLGNVGDVPALLAECDIFALPSRAEGSPVAMLEAMAAGLPTVSSAIPGTVEMVDNGVDGVLVVPDDHVGLSEALQALATDAKRRAELGAAGQRKVREKMSIDLEVGRHQSLYLEFLASR